jgi:DNA-binding protein H-NS
MSISLEGLSVKELNALAAQAKKRSDVLRKRKPIATVRKEAEALARKHGYTLAELVGAAPRAAGKRAPKDAVKVGKRAKVAPKYRNPAKPTETWAGRGKPPRWLAAELDQGRKLAEFAIAK